MGLAEETTPASARSRRLAAAVAFGKPWFDGVWLGFAFSLAAVAVTAPLVSADWLARRAGGPFPGVVRVAGTAFVVVAGPWIFARVFRALDFSKPEPSATAGDRRHLWN